MLKQSFSLKTMLIVLFLSSLMSVSVAAQYPADYHDALGQTWNNPMSATVTDIIVGRINQRLLEKSFAKRRARAAAAGGAAHHATGKSGTYDADNGEPKAIMPDSIHHNPRSVYYQASGIAIKLKDMVETIARTDADQKRALQFLSAILFDFEVKIDKLHYSNDLAFTLSYFLATNASIYRGTSEPSDAQLARLRDTLAAALVESDALFGVSHREKQGTHEMLVMLTGIARNGYLEAKRNNDAASQKIFQEMAGRNLQSLTGLAPDKVNLALDETGDNH